jgi:3-oxoacyl-[acyl-carrier-protein] synthase II
MACRATPITSPRPSEDGDGGFRAMKAALKDAGIEPGGHRLHQRPRHLDHGRRIEPAPSSASWAMHAKNVTMSSTKSMTGHLLGAAGAIEGIFSILAIRDQIAPPTINLDNPTWSPPWTWCRTRPSR